jgi:hypothetical protein
MLGGECAGSELSVVNAPDGTFLRGSPLWLLVRTPVASGGVWSVQLQQGDSSAPWDMVGIMLLTTGGNGNATFSFSMDGSWTQQLGPYRVRVQHPLVSWTDVLGSPVLLTAYAAPAAVNTSVLQAVLPAGATNSSGLAVGAAVTLVLQARDIFGSVPADPAAVDVLITGEACYLLVACFSCAYQPSMRCLQLEVL